MSIQRYDLVCRDWELYDLEPDDHGDWCSWDDVGPLIAQVDALACRVGTMAEEAVAVKLDRDALAARVKELEERLAALRVAWNPVHTLLGEYERDAPGPWPPAYLVVSREELRATDEAIATITPPPAAKGDEK